MYNALEDFTERLKNLIDEAKDNGISIKPYTKKINDIVIEEGIAVFSDKDHMNDVPTYKM